MKKKATGLILVFYLFVVIVALVAFNLTIYGDAAMGLTSAKECGSCKYYLNGTTSTKTCDYVKVGFGTGYCKCPVPDDGIQSEGCGVSDDK